MGLFGPSKIRITSKEFVKAQLDYLFSAEFTGQQRGQFRDLSSATRLLQRVQPETFVREKQNAVLNLLRIAFDRNIPYAVFIGSSSLMHDDPRIKDVDSGVYHCTLSRAQEAGMDTFGYIAMVFLTQVLPQGTDTSHPEFAKLFEVFGREFTGLYVTFEALVKRHKFIS